TPAPPPSTLFPYTTLFRSNDAPAYAAWQHYPDSNQWAEATLSRLRSWGMTTIGGWSDFGTLKRCRDAQVTFTPVLSVGAKAGARSEERRVGKECRGGWRG